MTCIKEYIKKLVRWAFQGRIIEKLEQIHREKYHIEKLEEIKKEMKRL